MTVGLLHLPENRNDIFERICGAEEYPGKSGQVIGSVGWSHDPRVEELFKDHQHFRLPEMIVSVVRFDLQM